MACVGNNMMGSMEEMLNLLQDEEMVSYCELGNMCRTGVWLAYGHTKPVWTL